MIMICGNCKNYWCINQEENIGFCQCDIKGRNYEDHPEECTKYEDKYGRDMTGYKRGITNG